ncbi:WbuC family cupin fold metalloprotein [Candidatus Cyanaurora vandensis]|nr:WbuC family cupin fold metalloprotein [Candidatus Cyanaurora vandensis]
MQPLKLLTQNLLNETATAARAQPRLRQNYNFHELEESIQRFVNVLQPGTYVRPHCHGRGFEFFLVLQGELGFLTLTEDGTVETAIRLSATGATKGLELTAGSYHTLVALTPDTALLEIKAGPYDPTTDKTFITSFPPEGTPIAAQWVATWEAYFQGPNDV